MIVWLLLKENQHLRSMKPKRTYVGRCSSKLCLFEVKWLFRQHFDIDPENMVQNTQAAPPCQQLQVLCAKKFKCNDNVKFEDLGTVGVRDHNSFGFKFKCIVDGHEFQGTGPTKKEAKNKAAAEALRVLFVSVFLYLRR